MGVLAHKDFPVHYRLLVVDAVFERLVLLDVVKDHLQLLYGLGHLLCHVLLGDVLALLLALVQSVVFQLLPEMLNACSR